MHTSLYLIDPAHLSPAGLATPDTLADFERVVETLGQAPAGDRRKFVQFAAKLRQTCEAEEALQGEVELDWEGDLDDMAKGLAHPLWHWTVPPTTVFKAFMSAVFGLTRELGLLVYWREYDAAFFPDGRSVPEGFSVGGEEPEDEDEEELPKAKPRTRAKAKKDTQEAFAKLLEPLGFELVKFIQKSPKNPLIFRKLTDVFAQSLTIELYEGNRVYDFEVECSVSVHFHSPSHFKKNINAFWGEEPDSELATTRHDWGGDQQNLSTRAQLPAEGIGS